MADVKALRELAAHHADRARYGGVAAEFHSRAQTAVLDALALLAEPGDDALPEGWTAQRDETCVPSTIYDNAKGHRVECFDDGDVLVDDESNTSYLRATELYAVLSHYLSRKGSDR